jgi:hypothetical protein
MKLWYKITKLTLQGFMKGEKKEVVIHANEDQKSEP